MPRLLYDDVLLKEGAPRQLIRLLGNARPEVQVAACRALVACCRFPAVQQEFVAENGVAPLVPLLRRSGVDPMVCVHACLAVTAVAQHPEGQEAFTAAGALRKLMVLARDELHPAQDEAAAALAAVGGHKAAANSAAVSSVSGQEAAESFVLMVANGGSVSREQVSVAGRGREGWLRRVQTGEGSWGARTPGGGRKRGGMRARGSEQAAIQPSTRSPPTFPGCARYPAALRHGEEPAAPG